MPSLEHFRMMPDEDLLLHGKETMTYTDEFVIALVQRFEDLLEELAEVGHSKAREVERLEDQIIDLLDETSTLHTYIEELERDLDELRSEISNTHC